MVKKIRVKKKRTQAQTPAPKKDQVTGSKKNPKGSASGSRGGIKISDKAIKTLENYKDEHNKKYSAKSKQIDMGTLKAIFRRGAGAFSSSHRPQVSSRTQWALARVKAFLKLVGTGERKKSYTTDLDLLPKGHPQRTDKETKSELLAIPDKYSHIDFVPPKGVQAAAKRALEVRATKPPSQRGGTEVGLARARDLSNGKQLSPDTVRRMLNYFTRHEVDKQGTTWSDQGKGWQAWNLWGGDAGYSYARKTVKQMNTADSKATSLTAYAEALQLNEIRTYEVPNGLTIGRPFKTLSMGQVSSRMNGAPLGDAIDHELLNEMVRVFNMRKESDPVIIDWQHATSPFQDGIQGPDAGNALGVIVDLELKDDGLYAVPAYNERGLKVVNEAGGILWSSPEYLHGEIFTRDGGDKVGDAQLLAITLTPRPAQQSDKIDRVTLKENLNMYSKDQLDAMDHKDLVDFATREQDLNQQKDDMIKQLEKQVKTMNEDNESKIAQDNEELSEHDKDEKLGEHSDDEKMNEHYDKKEEDEDKDKKMKEHQKMSESLASPALLSEIQMLREQVSQLRQDKIEVEKSSAVKQLLSEGKISPNEENVAREAYDMKLEGRDSFWAMFSERQNNSVVPMNTIGHGASGQEITKETINLKIKKLSEDKGLSYSQALTEFRTSNPSEYNQAYGV
jgi:phage I-like protein